MTNWSTVVIWGVLFFSLLIWIFIQLRIKVRRKRRREKRFRKLSDIARNQTGE